MCIGNTSARNRASRVPFFETPKSFNHSKIDGLAMLTAYLPDRNPLTSCADCVQLLPLSMGLLASDLYNGHAYQARLPMAAELHTTAIGAQ